MDREHWMGLAIREAEKCAATGDVPVGCVIVQGERIIAAGHNRREAEQSALGHAECDAIREACRALGGWRLSDCALYVTLEPCPMCAGAILNARIPVVCFGAGDPVMGACGGVLDLFSENFPHHPAVYAGVRREECARLLRDFFGKLRT